jgi:hypothetical protein
MTELLQRLFGERAANELRLPYALGDPDALRSMFGQAGTAKVEIRTRDGAARFLSIGSWVEMDVKGWTLGGMIDEAQYRTLLHEAESELKRFVQDDGTVAFSSPAHLVIATKD